MTEIPAWQEQGREVLLSAFMRKVEAVRYLMPNGEQATFNLAAEGEVAGVVAFTADDKIIITRQFRPGPNKVLWELPGGYLDSGEQPEQSAARELREETGYEGDIQYIASTFADAYSTKIRHYFTAKNCRQVGEQQLDGREFIQVTTVSLPEFREILRSGQMSDVAGGYLVLDKLNLL